MKNAIVRLSEYVKNATEAEVNVISYLLDSPEEAAALTIHELAKRTYSSASTIIRLCKKLGFKGYKDFSRSLIYELANRKDPEIKYDRDIEKDSSLQEVADKILYRSIAALEKTRALIEPEILRQCVQLFEQSSKMVFFGVGSSLLVGQDAKAKFMRINKISFCEADFQAQLVLAKNMDERDVGVIISYSGLTREMLDIAAILKKRKVPIISITRFADTELSAIADYRLWVASSEYLVRSAAMTSRLAQLYVIDILYAAYVQLDYENNIEKIQRTQMKKNKEKEGT